MKKIMITIIIAISILSTSTLTVSASSDAEELRTDFALSTISDLYLDEMTFGMNSDQQNKNIYVDMDSVVKDLSIDITYDISELLNTKLDRVGFLYEFSINNNIDGFLIMIEIELPENFNYIITEVYFNTNSPYNNATGKYIYTSLNGYFIFDEIGYYSLVNSIYIDIDILESLESNGFGLNGHVDGDTYDVEISYDRKTINSRDISYGLPLFSTSYASGRNDCGPTSAAIVLAYYDRLNTDLIPNYTAYDIITKTYGYYDYYTSEFRTYSYNTYTVKTGINNLKKDELVIVMDILYDKMNTNDWLGTGLDVGAGTLPIDYVNGLMDYVSEKGYTLNLYSANEWSALKNQINNNRPVIMSMFLPYEYIKDIEVNSSNTLETYNVEYNTVPHFMTGMGYRETMYYKNEVHTVWTPGFWPWQWFETTTKEEKLFKTTYLVKVADGWSGSGYITYNQSFEATGVEIKK